jgi:CRP/FNR family transcriptional regulator, cyclic AMP receptor protein
MARTSPIDHLAGVPLFAALSKRDLQKIAKASTQLSVEEGRNLVEQGATGHEGFVILDGEAVVKRNGRKIATLAPGDVFGELSLFDGGPRSATVTATSKLDVLVIGQREFTGVLDEVPGVAHKILANLASRVRELDTKIYG